MATAAPALDVVARFAALAMVGLGFVVLLGWLFGIELLTRVLPGLATMKPITALKITAVTANRTDCSTTIQKVLRLWLYSYKP